MNTQTYRLVFSPARACMVAVAETARGCGKGGKSGGTRDRRRRRALAICEKKVPLAPVEWTKFAINSAVSAGVWDAGSDPFTTSSYAIAVSCPQARQATGINFQPRFFARQAPFDGAHLTGAALLHHQLAQFSSNFPHPDVSPPAPHRQ